MRPSLVAPLFYSGVLISSIGSGAFGMALFAFLLLNHFSLSEAALMLGLQRIVPTLVLAWSGHWTDRWPPKITILLAELIAAILSLVLLLVWRGPDSDFLLLTVFSVARSVVVSFQQGSRAKISKMLSGATYLENSRHAMWLNKATQGASLFSGALAWVFVTYASLETAILFDCVTFALNGIIVFLMPDFNENKLVREATASGVGEPPLERWHDKFRELVKWNRQAVWLDVGLFFCTGGLVAYSARISGSEPGWSGLFVAVYGLAVWVAGFMERSLTSKFSTFPCWLGIALSFLALGQFQKANALALAVFFLKDLCFWIIFHRVSAHLQMRTPVAKMGSVSSARSVLIVLISAGSEILVGAWSKIVSLPTESAIRAAIALGFGIYVFLAGRKSRSREMNVELSDVRQL